MIQFTVTTEGVTDLTGLPIQWGMSDEAGTTAHLTKTDGDDISVDGVKVFVVFNENDLNAVSPGQYYHELVITDANGNDIQAAVGTAHVFAVTL